MKNYKDRRLFFALLLLLKIFTSIKGVIAAREIECESVVSGNWGGSDGVVTVCWMHETTWIKKTGVTISTRDESVKGLTFIENKNIFYLPDDVGDTFPNLEGYEAYKCSVKAISKSNFNGLHKLKYLSLGRNQIETVASGTFEGLTKLEVLQLYDNKIKSMNGKAFQGLNRLKTVYLEGNICIGEHFEGPTQISKLQQTVNEKCGFEESAVDKPSLALSIFLSCAFLITFLNCKF